MLLTFLSITICVTANADDDDPISIAREAVFQKIDEDQALEKKEIIEFILHYPVGEDLKSATGTHIDPSHFRELKYVIKEFRAYQALAARSASQGTKRKNAYDEKQREAQVRLQHFFPSLQDNTQSLEEQKENRSNRIALRRQTEERERFQETLNTVRTNRSLNQNDLDSMIRAVPEGTAHTIAISLLSDEWCERLNQPRGQLCPINQRTILWQSRICHIHSLMPAHYLAKRYALRLSDQFVAWDDDESKDNPQMTQLRKKDNFYIAQWQRHTTTFEKEKASLLNYTSNISDREKKELLEKKTRFRNKQPQHRIGGNGRRKSHDR